MRLFCLQLQSFLLTAGLSYLQLTILGLFNLQLELFLPGYNFSFFAYSWSGNLAHSGRVRLINMALTGTVSKGKLNCKQKKARTVGKKALPVGHEIASDLVGI